VDERFFQPPAPAQRVREVVVRGHEVGAQQEGLAVAGDRLLEAPGVEEEDAEVVVRLGMVGTQHERPPVSLFCLGIALRGKHAAEQVPGRVQVRLRREHGLELALGLGHAPEREERLRAVVARAGSVGPGRDRTFEPGEGFVGAALLCEHDAEELQRLRVAGVQRHHPAQ
jgi:hypothetical protein